MNVIFNEIKVVNKDEKMFLYLDEKGERDISNQDKPNHFFIGGILINEKSRLEIIEFMKRVKSSILPKLEIDKWELKGNTAYINNKKITKNFRERYNQTASFKFSKRKWSEWAKFFDDNDIKYEIYGTFIDNQKFISSLLDSLEVKKQEDLIINEAYSQTINSLIKLELYSEEIDFTKIDNEKGIYEANKIITRYNNTKIVFDNINGKQKRIIEDAHNKIRYENRDIVDINRLEIIDSNDYSSDDSLVMQFVDMQIFILYRFALTEYDKKYNFLNGYEEFNRIPFEQRKVLTNLPLNEQKNLAFKHYLGEKLIMNVTSRIASFGANDSSVKKIPEPYEISYGNVLANTLVSPMGVY